MALQVVVTPGITLADGTSLTYALLRQLARPTVTIDGSVNISDLPDLGITNVKIANATIVLSDKAVAGSITTALYEDGSITTDKVAPGAYFYAAGVYAAGVYGVTVSPAPGSYLAGQIYRFKADTTNTGAVDLNFNSLGAKNLYKNVSSELVAGDIVANQMVEVIYDGTNFQLLGGSTPLWMESAEQAVATGATTAVAHGLSAKPRFVRGVLVCKTAELGYSIGDEVDLSGAINTLNPMALVGANATNVFVIVRNVVLQVLRYDTQAAATITNGNWRFKFYYR